MIRFMRTSESGTLWQRRTIVPASLIRFLDKMVNTILSCESFAGRRWRREMYGLTFFAAAPLAAETAAE